MKYFVSAVSVFCFHVYYEQSENLQTLIIYFSKTSLHIHLMLFTLAELHQHNGSELDSVHSARGILKILN